MLLHTGLQQFGWLSMMVLRDMIWDKNLTNLVAIAKVFDLGQWIEQASSPLVAHDAMKATSLCISNIIVPWELDLVETP